MSAAAGRVAGGTSTPAAGAAVLAFLARARRRAGRVRVVSALSVAIPIAATSSLAATVVTGLSLTALALISGGVLLLIAAVAYLTRPSAAAVADEVDRRLALRDRAAMALRVRSRTDDVACAIVEDAARHLAPASVDQAFPVRTHRHALPAGTVAAVAACVWLLYGPADDRASRPREGGVLFGGAPPRAGVPPVGSPTDTPTPSVLAAAQPTTADTATQLTIDGPRAATSLADPSTDARRTTAAEAGTDTADPGDPSPASPGIGGRSGGAAAQGAEASSQTAAAGAGDSRGRTTSTRPGAAGSAGPMGSIRTSGTAGGVSDGTLDDAVIAPRIIGARVSGSTTIGKATAIDAAIAHEDIPVGRRPFLRDYQRRVQALPQP